MKKILLSSFLMMNIGIIYSQNQGLVLDSYGIPISGAEILFSDEKILFFSNEDGIFYYTNNIPNNSYINCYKSGYKTIVVQYIDGHELKFVLEKLHVSLDEIGISESVSEIGSSKLISIEKKSLKDISFNPTSLVEDLSKITGIDAISSGLGIQKIAIRGLSGMRVVTYLNGMKIENQQWANDHGIGFTDLGLYEVELLKGSAALKYGGEAVGGLLYFKDNPFVTSNKLSGFISTKFDNSHFLSTNQIGLTWSLNNLFFNFYSQYSLSTDYRLPNNRFLFNSRFRNQAIKISIANRRNKWQNIFRYQYNSEQLGIPAHSHSSPEDISISDISSGSIAFYDDFKATRPTQFVNNHLFITESNYFTNRSKLSFQFGYYINNLMEYEKWTIPAFDMHLTNTEFRLDLRTKLNPSTFNIGFQIGVLSNENNTIENLIPDAETNNLGAYSTYDYEKEKFGLSIGSRIDYKTINCSIESYKQMFSALSNSLGFYIKDGSHLIRFTYSGAFRSPHFAELFSDGVHHGTSRYELGNRNLVLERGHQFDIKYQWSNNHFGFVINPFSQNISNFIAINPTNDFFEVNYRKYVYTQFEKVNLSGLEFNLHYHPHILHNLHFEQSYSFINTKNYDKNTVLALTPSNKIKTSIKLELNKAFGIVDLNNLLLYHIYSFNQENVVEYETSSDMYSLLNMSLDIKLFSALDIVFGINNLFNKEYVPHLSRVKDIAGGIPNPGRSYSIGLNYRF